MKLSSNRAARWGGLALLWLLGSLGRYQAGATTLPVRLLPTGVARITQGDINRVEYFIDADPGLGNGTSVPLTAAADVSNLTFSVSLSGLTPGFHRLSTRSQDASGVWSLTTSRSFYYQAPATTTPTLVNITKVEYFIDADPGLGNGINVPIAAPATDVSGLAFTVNLAALTTGFHRLSTRSRDANGVWSLTTTRSFYFQPAATTTPPLANITKVEYFIDAEPGLGNGIDVPVGTPATDVSGLAFTVNLSALSAGFHRLSTRSRDANGVWSLTTTRSFYYQNLPTTPPALANITRLEYYIDTDPGFGSATSVPVPTPAPDLPNVGFAIDLSTLADGAHRAFFRSRDADGKWSLVNSFAFTKSGCASAVNYAAGLPAASYTGTNFNGTLSVAFNTDPAVPNFSNSPYYLASGAIQTDLGTTQTISEVRLRLTTSGVATATTIQIQTAATATGPFTTVDTYVASIAANGSQPVVRKFATPLSARVLRLQLQNSGNTIVAVSGAGIFNFPCVTPSITSLTPNVGPVGTSFTVTGANLQGTSVLTFAGASNNTVTTGFTVSADGTTITGVVVPAGATTGNLTATTPNGTSNGVSFTVTGQPALTSIAPTSGPLGSTVVLNGANLAGTSVITFAGTSNNTVAAGYTVNAAGTQITGIVVPSGAATGNVTVTTPGGTSNAVTFTVTAPLPTLISFSPTSGPVGAGVLLTGTSLDGATAVRFNGTSATGYTVNSAGTQITVAVPSGATTGPISVTTPAGSVTSASSFTVTAAAPVISAFSPGYVRPGDALTITGQNLQGVTQLRIGGATQTVFSVNAGGTQLTTTVPAASYVVGGTTYPLTSRLIALTTPGGQAVSATKLRIFNVTGYYDGALGYNSPPSQATGTTYPVRNGDRVYVRGSGFLGATGAAFVPGTAVGCGSTTALTATPTVLNDSMLYVVFQYNLAGNGFNTTGVSLTTTLGSQTPQSYSGNAFFFNPQIVTPFAACLAPASGPVGTRVVVSGSWLLGGNAATGLTFNGVAGLNVTTTTGALPTVAADVPASLSPGAVAVRVVGTGPDFASTTDPSVVLPFTLTAPAGPAAPTLSSLSVTNGPIGTTLTINGTNLSNTSLITFAGISNNTVASGYTVNAAGTQITGVVVPSGAATGNVTVTTPGGISNAVTFTVTAPQLAVSQGSTGYPSGGAAYSFGSQVVATSSSAVPFTLTNTGSATLTINSITATGDYATTGALPTSVAAGGTATASVVFTPLATGTRTGTLVITSSLGTYTVNLTGTGSVAAPVISSFTPTSGPVATSVTVMGSGFGGATAVAFNGVGAPGFVVNTTGTQFTVSVPNGATTGPISVTTPGGMITSSGSFTVTAPLPTLTSLSPTSGPTGSTIALTGTNLTGASLVTFAGAGANTVTSGFTVNAGGTQLTGVVVPSGATTGNVTVTTPGGVSNGLLFTVTPLPYPDLIISTGTLASPVSVVAGTYNSVTVTGTGVAQLSNAITVNTSVLVQTGGVLISQCQPLTGAASFTLEAGTTFNICDPAGIAASGSTGAVQTTGPRSFSPGASYWYVGTQAQVTGSGLPSRVLNLVVANTSGVTLSQGVAITQVLNLVQGNLTTASQPLTLLSSAAGTALIVNGASGGTVVGTGTMQRYIDASGNAGASGYRHYSAPVSNTTVADLATTATGGSFVPVVNAAFNTSASPTSVTPYPTVYGYDESRIATSPAASFTDFDKGYVSPTALTDALAVGRGYTVQIGNNELVDFNGTFNTGPVTLSNLTRGTSPDAGWQLLGNPYPAPIDWSTVGTGGSGRTGLDAAAYVFQSTGPYTGVYHAFVNGIGAGTGVMAAGQGFFVRTSTPGTPATLTLTNANRLTTFSAGQPAVQRTANTRPLLRLSLGLGALPATPATAQDETFVYFEQGATAGFDGSFDAHKLLNTSGYYLATATPGSSPLGLSVDGRAPLAAGLADEVVPVWLGVPAGSYSLTATELANFGTLAGGTTVYLRDGLVGTLTDLSQQPSYAFSVAAGASTSGRFSLVFRPATALGVTASQGLTQVLTSLYPNPTATATEVTLAVTGLPATVPALAVVMLDAVGREVSHYKLTTSKGAGQLQLPTTNLASGMYLLRLTALDAQGQSVGALPTQRLSLH